MRNLLPPNSTPLERAVTEASSSVSGLPVPLRELWRPMDIPARLLPWLAWTLAVDEWNEEWSVDRKRAAIVEAVPNHRRRGTPWSIRRALTIAGYPAIEIIEQREYQRAWTAAGGLVLDGSWKLDGSAALSIPNIDATGTVTHRIALNHWAQYALRINVGEQPWSARDQRTVHRVATAYAPARSELVSIVASLHRRFSAPIRMLRSAERLSMRLRCCRRFQPLERRTLDGCWTLGGTVTEPLIDGCWKLDGSAVLEGRRLHSSWAWAAGHFTATAQVRIRATFSAGQGVIPARTLNPGFRVLNGRWRLNRHTLQGWVLDEGISLADAQLDRIAAKRIDGTWLLGAQKTPACISMRATATLRNKALEITL